MAHATKRKSRWLWLQAIGSVVACLSILGGAVAAIVVIYQTEPTAQQIKSKRKSAALVETITVERAACSPRISVLGTVEPAQDIRLSPRINGQVSSVSRDFVPGGIVKAGKLLVQLDPTDFKNAVSIEESELKQVLASLRIEQGRQALARQELELLQDTIEDIDRALVLREPQIASIRAEVSAAEADLTRAKTDLERTDIKAPFDAQILSRSVNVGSQVSAGDELARLVGVDEYWIMASVPVRSLRWIRFPAPEPAPEEEDGSEGQDIEMVNGEQREQSPQGSKVTLRNTDTWPPGVERTAYVARLIGTLDDETRLARVLITVPDPLGRNTDAPPLIIGSLIEIQIEGRPMDDVIRLERDYIRGQDTVWVMNEGLLEIRDVEVVFRDAEYAYVKSGLETGDEVITTNLATPAQGIPLRKIEELREENVEASDETASSDDPASAEAANSTNETISEEGAKD